jgi:hypothetical protein
MLRVSHLTGGTPFPCRRFVADDRLSFDVMLSEQIEGHLNHILQIAYSIMQAGEAGQMEDHICICQKNGVTKRYNVDNEGFKP